MNMLGEMLDLNVIDVLMILRNEDMFALFACISYKLQRFNQFVVCVSLQKSRYPNLYDRMQSNATDAFKIWFVLPVLLQASFVFSYYVRYRYIFM